LLGEIAVNIKEIKYALRRNVVGVIGSIFHWLNDPLSKNTLVEWVDQAERDLGWTDADWAAKANLSEAILRQARQGMTPKFDKCVALATAANRPMVTALRRARLLPPGPDEVLVRDWKYLLAQMSDNEQDELAQKIEQWFNEKCVN